MTPYLLFASLILPFAATAQKLQATSSPRIYQVGPTPAPLYRTPADTADAKVPFNLPAGSEATVVGQYSSRWVVVKRQGFLYLTSQALLVSPDGPPKLLDGTALPYDADSKHITYQGVVEVPGLSKEQLYTRAYEWLAKSYRSANAVIQMQDKEAGRLVGKGNAQVLLRGYEAGFVRHTITLYLKDGRYKYVLTDLEHVSSGFNNVVSGGPLERPDGTVMSLGGKKAWDEVRRQAHVDAQSLITSLQAAMNVKASKDPSDF